MSEPDNDLDLPIGDDEDQRFDFDETQLRPVRADRNGRRLNVRRRIEEFIENRVMREALGDDDWDRFGPDAG